MTARAWTLLETGVPIATGVGEVEGYTALLAHTIYSVEYDFELDHGMHWPVGRSLCETYALTFADSQQRIVVDGRPGDLFVLLMWVFGKTGGGKDFRIVRDREHPHRDRLEMLVRAYMRHGGVKDAMNDLSLDYMKVIQGPDDQSVT